MLKMDVANYSNKGWSGGGGGQVFQSTYCTLFLIENLLDFKLQYNTTFDC